MKSEIQKELEKRQIEIERLLSKALIQVETMKSLLHQDKIPDSQSDRKKNQDVEILLYVKTFMKENGRGLTKEEWGSITKKFEIKDIRSLSPFFFKGCPKMKIDNGYRVLGEKGYDLILDSIINDLALFAERRYDMLVGEKTLEELYLEVVNGSKDRIKVSGRSHKTGNRKTVYVSRKEVKSLCR